MPNTVSAAVPLVVLGSARHPGDTSQLVSQVLANVPHRLLNLLEWPTAPYSYAQNYAPDDGFVPLVRQLLPHPTIIFATPVYWYSMSGVMKTFFDRLTDLTAAHKPLGRALAGKQVFLLAIGSDQELPPGFEIPFQLTAEYFRMTFAGSFYQSIKQPFATEAAQEFAQRISATYSNEKTTG